MNVTQPTRQTREFLRKQAETHSALRGVSDLTRDHYASGQLAAYLACADQTASCIQSMSNHAFSHRAMARGLDVKHARETATRLRQAAETLEMIGAPEAAQ